ncbi:MAG: hypothetical protein AAF468_08525 [Pseudomonadota bacterium]
MPDPTFPQVGGTPCVGHCPTGHDLSVVETLWLASGIEGKIGQMENNSQILRENVRSRLTVRPVVLAMMHPDAEIFEKVPDYPAQFLKSRRDGIVVFILC